MAELFTLDEVAAIAEIEPDSVRTALEKKSVTPSKKVKTGKVFRYRFSVGDVLFLLVITEFPFPLTKEDKNSLAKVVAHGNKTAKHWASEGADLVFRSGEMTIIVEWKSLRETVEKNVAAYRWGKERIVSSPDILGGEPVFRGTRVPLATWRLCSAKTSRRRTSLRTSLHSTNGTWNTPDLRLDSQIPQAVRRSFCASNGSKRIGSDSSPARREHLAVAGEQTR